jgi:DNA-binding transcriptional MerR regulator/trans-aconitate methyltransferase
MYLISELAAKVRISRTTLLYYEKLGLIKGMRRDNGYRFYSERDLQRLYLIKQLQSAGLSLKECQTCLDEKIDKSTLRERLTQLEHEIEEKIKARELLLGLIGEKSQRELHISLNQNAPNEYANWLHNQGFEEKEALRIRWLSKDINDHEHYMKDFMRIFSTVERWGPGSEHATLQALRSIPPQATKHILEIGCGKGTSTVLLAQETNAMVTAVDNEPLAIGSLETKAHDLNLNERIHPLCASMTDLPFEHDSFDVIWAEGCVYIMGMAKALQQWKPLLKKNGYMMVSDLVWLTDSPDDESKHYWLEDYPDISDIPTRLKLFREYGYEVITHFSLGVDGWKNYWEPLEEKINELKKQDFDSQVLIDIETEIAIYKKSAGEDFTYQYFILKTK